MVAPPARVGVNWELVRKVPRPEATSVVGDRRSVPVKPALFPVMATSRTAAAPVAWGSMTTVPEPVRLLASVKLASLATALKVAPDATLIVLAAANTVVAVPLL